MNQLVRDWLASFEAAVCAQDFEAGLALHIADPVLFGTRKRLSQDIFEYQDAQWKVIWPKSRDFKFTNIVRITSSNDLAVASVTWENYTEVDGQFRLRTGRATYAFQLRENRLLAVHSHYSEDPPTSF